MITNHTYGSNQSLFPRESIKAMKLCVSDVRKWMLANRLMINDSKTEVMLVGKRQQLSKVSVECIRVGVEVIASVSTFKNLGVYLDQNFKMDKHITKLCSKAFYQLYKLKRIRKFLSNDAIKTVVHAFITSNLDYCNSLFYGMPITRANNLSIEPNRMFAFAR